MRHLLILNRINRNFLNAWKNCFTILFTSIKMPKIIYVALIALALHSFPLPGHATSAQEMGLAIAVEADRRASDFTDYTADMVMILRNRDGQESRRSIRTLTLENIEDGDKSLTIFDSPRDIRGTALLTYGHKIEDDDQWLYLPALKRVKRISSSNKSGSFMGSEFAYEDLGSKEIGKYSYTFLREELLEGQNCFVIEMYPKDVKNSGYSRIVSWVDQKEYRTYRQLFYDKKKSLLKKLQIKDYRQYLGFIWRAHQLEMENIQNGKATVLILSNFKFRNGLSEKDFDKNSLKRMR